MVGGPRARTWGQGSCACLREARVRVFVFLGMRVCVCDLGCYGYRPTLPARSAKAHQLLGLQLCSLARGTDVTKLVVVLEANVGSELFKPCGWIEANAPHE